MSSPRIAKRLKVTKIDSKIEGFLQAGQHEKKALLQFFGTWELAKLTVVSKTFYRRISPEVNSRCYKKLLRFIHECGRTVTNDGKIIIKSESVKNCLKDFKIQRLHLSSQELSNFIDASFCDYLREVLSIVKSSNFNIENFSEPVELLFSPEILERSLTVSARDLLQTIFNCLHRHFLYEAANSEKVVCYIQRGCDFNYIKDHNSGSVYQKALINGYLSTLQVLIEYGADVDAAFDLYEDPVFDVWGDRRAFMTPLMYMATRSNIEGLQLFLTACADVDRSFTTPRQSESEENKSLILTEETALSYAAKYDNAAPADILIQHKAYLNHSNNDGDTPLLIALRNWSYEVAQLILKKYSDKVDLNHANNKGDTALLIAANTANNSDVVDLLIKAGADVLRVNNVGKTALQLAKQSQDSWTMEECVSAKGEISEREVIVALLEAAEKQALIKAACFQRLI